METLLILIAVIITFLWIYDSYSKEEKIALLEHELYCRKKYGDATVDYWDKEAQEN